MIDIEMQGRSAIRRAVRVYCETVANDGFRRIGMRTRDLSIAGALIEVTDANVSIGDEVYLSFKAPRTAFWIDTRARVVRLLRGRRRGEEGQLAIGVEFLELDGAYRAVLEASLRNIPPPLPARPYRESSVEVLVDVAR